MKKCKHPKTKWIGGYYEGDEMIHHERCELCGKDIYSNTVEYNLIRRRNIEMATAEETLQKARAVLAEHSRAVVWAKRVLAYPNEKNEAVHKALIALADAIGGGE